MMSSHRKRSPTVLDSQPVTTVSTDRFLNDKFDMSVVLDDSEDFKKNPLYSQHEFGDFSAFYITITICTVIGFTLIILNTFFCWCSNYSEYWTNSNTGNRWISSIWTRTPYRHPPIDLSELEGQAIQVREVYEANQEEYLELAKRESDL